MKQRFLPLFAFLCMCVSVQAQYPTPTSDEDWRDDYYSRERIQIALLLDVSGSMDDLIGQAKSQLWQMVNGIMYQYPYGQEPQLELALYEYGSDRISSRSNYLRQVVPFTSDLDWISEELFQLRVDGRHEYCGAAIYDAVQTLNWSYGPRDQRLLYIAGNESFRRGPISARRAIEDASQRGIVVHTIFCGNDYEGRSSGWADAAYWGGGQYLSIDHHDYDPYRNGGRYDNQLLSLDARWNQTYIPYGPRAGRCYRRQQQADRYARQYGTTIASQRVIAKASAAYCQPEWDLVDAITLGQVTLAEVPSDQLPPDMQRMSPIQREAYVQQKAQERRALRQEIRTLAEAKQREPAPVGRPSLSGSGASTATAPGLGSAIVQSATTRGNPSRPSPQTTPRPRPTQQAQQPIRYSSPQNSWSSSPTRPQPSRQRTTPTVNPSSSRTSPSTRRQQPTFQSSSSQRTSQPKPAPSRQVSPQRKPQPRATPSRQISPQRTSQPKPTPSRQVSPQRKPQPRATPSRQVSPRQRSQPKAAPSRTVKRPNDR